MPPSSTAKLTLSHNLQSFEILTQILYFQYIARQNASSPDLLFTVHPVKHIIDLYLEFAAVIPAHNTSWLEQDNHNQNDGVNQQIGSGRYTAQGRVENTELKV